MPRAARRGSRALVATTAAAVTITARMTRAGVMASARGASGGRRLLVGVHRGLEDAEGRDRPVAEECAPDHVADGDRAEHARVGGALAVVAHDEQLAVGNDPARLRARLRRLRDAPGAPGQGRLPS